MEQPPGECALAHPFWGVCGSGPLPCRPLTDARFPSATATGRPSDSFLVNPHLAPAPLPFSRKLTNAR